MDTIITKIYHASTKFLEPLDPEKAYQIIVDEAGKLVGAAFGSITLLQNNRFVRVYASSPLLYKINIRKHGYTYKSFKEKKIYVAFREENIRTHPASKELRPESVVYIPLSYKDKSIGVLTLASQKKEDFGKQEIEVLRFFGSLATLAIKKAQLYDETRRALETRDLFISMAAHEFRTPLTTISGYSQLLKKRFDGKDTVESEWVKELYDETIRLTKLVNELLEVNRIKRGVGLNLHFSECRMEQIVQRSVNNFRFSHPSREIIFKSNLLDNDDIVVGDSDKLIQIISNVLDNAARFSPQNTPINIDLTFKPPHVIVSIRDKGKGIEKKDLPKIMERYYKADKEDQRGIGLGLFLVKEILDKHNGVLKISSKVGKGTQVDLKFPRIKI